jgi:hypothetical protein
MCGIEEKVKKRGGGIRRIKDGGGKKRKSGRGGKKGGAFSRSNNYSQLSNAEPPEKVQIELLRSDGAIWAVTDGSTTAPPANANSRNR